MKQRGYVLPATLLLLALLALVAGRLAGRIDLLREQSFGLSAYADGLVAAHGARAQVLYRMATQTLSPAGLVAPDGAVLPLDSRPVELGGGAVVRLQDHRGLLGVNAPDPVMLPRLLVGMGVPDSRAGHLMDTLADYTDTDSLHRLNGAEARDYEERGLPPPRNDWMASAEELRQIIGWRDYPEVLERVIPLLSSRRDGYFNANTAPREVLAARFPQLAPSQLDALLERRRIVPFASSAEVSAMTGVVLVSSDEDLYFPSDRYRLTISVKDLPMAYVYNIWLTPNNVRQPWQILDSRVVPAPVK